MSAPVTMSHFRWRPAVHVALTLCLGMVRFDAMAQQPDDPVDHEAMGHGQMTPSPRSKGPYLPPITEADRAAAFPDLAGHTAHDQTINYFVLLDQLEWQDTDEGGALNWDARAWVGRDIDRL